MKKTVLTVLIVILFVSIAAFGPACKSQITPEEPVGEDIVEIDDSEEVQVEEEFEPVPEAVEEKQDEKDSGDVMEGVDENASYSIRFEATWSSDSHPDNYVSNAHFSPFVIYSYNGTDQGRIFTVGSEATAGMKDMAETGATGILEDEIKQIIEANNALKYSKAKSFNSPGQTEVVLEFTPEFSQFIFVSMIAPSPDWFVAAEGDVFVEGQWIEQLVLDVVSFDAGTDSGDSLTAADSDTDPKQPISLFDDYLQGLGIVTISRN